MEITLEVFGDLGDPPWLRSVLGQFLRFFILRNKTFLYFSLYSSP